MEKEYSTTDVYNKILELEQKQKDEKLFKIIISVVVFLLSYKMVKR